MVKGGVGAAPPGRGASSTPEIILKLIAPRYLAVNSLLGTPGFAMASKQCGHEWILIYPELNLQLSLNRIQITLIVGD